MTQSQLQQLPILICINTVSKSSNEYNMTFLKDKKYKANIIIKSTTSIVLPLKDTTPGCGRLI